MSIIVEDLSYTYLADTPMQQQALFGINLEIMEGEFLGLIGHTGSGKSTLIQHFNGLIRPIQGRVLVDGVNLGNKSIGLKEIRRKVGMVFQYPEHQLFGETVFEDVAFGPKNLGVSETEVDARVRDALDVVDLDFDTVQHRSPFELSGGQKRRVAIAGVLAMRPSTLILDEPTAGLDPRGRDEILAQIQRLHQDWNMTVVLVTHSMDDVARLASRLVVLEKGRIVLEGSPREVFVHAEQLGRIGLGVPQLTRLLQELKQRGFPVDSQALGLEETAEQLKKILESQHYGHV